MSFWEHLDVLRGSIIRVLTAVCALSCIGLAFKEPLFRLILAPADPDFFVYRLMGASFSMELINVDISAQFFVHLKASLAMGFILAFPYAIWELWRFIAPALYPGERKAVGRTFLLSSGLFYLGAAVGYVLGGGIVICLKTAPGSKPSFYLFAVAAASIGQTSIGLDKTDV